MNRKRITLLVVISLLLVVVFASTYSYALFESEITGDVKTKVASWRIKINNSLIAEGINNSFVIDNINYTQTDSNVRSGKFAPGIEGYYDILIDPTNTDVSIKFSIIVSDFDTENLRIDRIQLMDGGTVTDEGNGVYSGIIPLSNRRVKRVRIFLVWEDLNTDEANQDDSELGTRDNPDVNIPVEINLIQYLGE